MSHLKHSFVIMLQGLVMALGVTLVSQVSIGQETVKVPPKDIVLKGDAKCTRCHDEGEAYQACDGTEQG